MKGMAGKKNRYILFFLLLLGIVLRFLVMLVGHNFDFESYCIVGEIAGNFRNVYAETSRYNYGFIFFCIQGLLYKLAINFLQWELVYRILIVMVLTLTDVGIAYIIRKKYSDNAAIIFFLNPVSIIITGFHNQFDNIAIFFALLCTFFYNEEKDFSKKDILFIVFLSLSLITKHIFFLMPIFIILREKLPNRKKVCYAVLPPMVFLISFIPFVINNVDALKGMLNNVFLYRSFNNAPLLQDIYNLIGMPSGFKFYVYIVMMLFFAFLLRKEKFDRMILLYMMALVSFSSAIANQYLAIPLAALCVIEVGGWKYIYMIIVGGFLILQSDGLNVLGKLQRTLGGKVDAMVNFYVMRGYNIAAWILLFAIMYNQIYQTGKYQGGLLLRKKSNF